MGNEEGGDIPLIAKLVGLGEGTESPRVDDVVWGGAEEGNKGVDGAGDDEDAVVPLPLAVLVTVWVPLTFSISWAFSNKISALVFLHTSQTCLALARASLCLSWTFVSRAPIAP